MALNRLVSSSLQYIATHSASGLAETGGERFGEPTRIAQELHDTLLQGFFAVSMQLRVAVEHLAADSAAEGRFEPWWGMSPTGPVGKSCIGTGQVGDLLHDRFIAPSTSPTLGQDLVTVPNDLCLPSTAGFRVVVGGEQRELKVAPRDELYRIGREAILNAYRHSRAKHIEAEIEYRTAELRIAVRDDGCGIDPQVLLRKGHWGLREMRERAERIGARLRILSRVALGTEVELRVPGRVAFEQGEMRWMASA